jgi:type III pantothenate kinase
MHLAIDMGNTNTSLGVYDGEKVVAYRRLTTALSRTVDKSGVD